MNVGETIKIKRKELGLTQAQIAETLGVSAPAVNKWEKGISYPDAELLAPLARLLKTDLNVLMGFYEELTDSERDEIASALLIMTVKEDNNAAKTKRALEYVDECIRNNPRDGKLFEDLATNLLILGRREIDNNEGSERPLLSRAIALYEEAYILVPESRDEITYALMNIFNEIGEFDKANSALEKISDCEFDKDWVKVEMLIAQKDYESVEREMKSLILESLIENVRRLRILARIMKEAGKEELSNEAIEKSRELAGLFMLWEGINYMEDIEDVIGDGSPQEEEVEKLAKFDAEISRLELFKDTKLERRRDGLGNTWLIEALRKTAEMLQKHM